jgi:hypothetical protein
MDTPEISLQSENSNTSMISDLSSFLHNKVNLVMEIDEFVSSMEPVTDLDKFVVFKDSVRDFMK